MESAGSDDKKAAELCFETVGLDPDLYRCGHTKVFFRAGILGQMEDIRDERLGKIMSWLQAWARGYLIRKDFKKLQAQRQALEVVKRNLRKYLKLRTWAWYRMYAKIKPLLNVSRVEDQISVSCFVVFYLFLALIFLVLILSRNLKRKPPKLRKRLNVKKKCVKSWKL